ncbi:MAG: hypothetical protein U5K55_06525 [Aliarcobacter sp.]|nr:hypothetical protein [Aliarcobacter sp.]
MADLNPSIENTFDKNIFDKALKEISKQTYEEGVKQGEKYFYSCINRDTEEFLISI